MDGWQPGKHEPALKSYTTNKQTKNPTKKTKEKTGMWLGRAGVSAVPPVLSLVTHSVGRSAKLKLQNITTDNC